MLTTVNCGRKLEVPAFDKAGGKTDPFNVGSNIGNLAT